MNTQDRDVEIGGGIVHIISTFLKMLLYKQQNPKNIKWIEIPEKDYIKQYKEKTNDLNGSHRRRRISTKQKHTL